jgi:bis(5'-nucleosyl)-tetraphosphatase (symmetrical)
MPTYAIGDVHGCLEKLEELLKLINFSEENDTIWFVGDIVGRGKHSLETLKFIINLKNKVVVLGNHDMHLLALKHQPEWQDRFPALKSIFAARNCDELLTWLSNQKLLHYDENLGFVMVHAGIPKEWDLAKATLCANEVETILHNPKKSLSFLLNMYGNKPDQWDDNLTGILRFRFIVNALTRMRFCDLNGKLNLTCKAKIGEQPAGFIPWFQLPDRRSKNLKIIFGHWAALKGIVEEPNVFALDTGCVWGNQLTAMCLETMQKFSVSCGLK